MNENTNYNLIEVSTFFKDTLRPVIDSYGAWRSIENKLERGRAPVVLPTAREQRYGMEYPLLFLRHGDECVVESIGSFQPGNDTRVVIVFQPYTESTPRKVLPADIIHDPADKDVGVSKKKTELSATLRKYIMNENTTYNLIEVSQYFPDPKKPSDSYVIWMMLMNKLDREGAPRVDATKKEKRYGMTRPVLCLLNGETCSIDEGTPFRDGDDIRALMVFNRDRNRIQRKCYRRI